jgi:hypothetical protein
MTRRQIVSPVYAPPARPNPFLCSYCGEDASERHYDRATAAHVASFCRAHSPETLDPDTAAVDGAITGMTGDSSATATGESVENCGVVSGPPTESGEFGASTAPVWPFPSIYHIDRHETP